MLGNGITPAGSRVSFTDAARYGNRFDEKRALLRIGRREGINVRSPDLSLFLGHGYGLGIAVAARPR
jgi:hypothetical protein